MILVDTREQKNKHITDAFDRMGILWDRSKLYVGDYALIEDMSLTVDRKAGMHEVYSNLIQQHERFRREAARAKQAGVRLIVLVEEYALNTLEDVEHWKNPRIARYDFIEKMHRCGKMLNVKNAARRPVDSARLMAIMRSMTLKYGVEWRFTSKEKCGEEIVRMLMERKHEENKDALESLSNVLSGR